MSCVVILFGSNGFIGSNLKSLLLSKSIRLITVDLANADFVIDVNKLDLEKIADSINCVDNVGIINCSGFNPKVEIVNSEKKHWYDMERWLMCHDINLHFPYALSRFASKLLDRVKGKIDVIHLGSMYSTRAPNNNLYNNVDGIDYKPVEYISSKHAMVGMVRGLEALKISNRIRFNLICPGAVFSSAMPESFVENFENITGGNLNNVEELSDFISSFIFNYWSLFRGAVIETYGGALN